MPKNSVPFGSRAIPECAVCENTGKNQSQGECHDDHGCSSEPGDRFCQGHNAEVIDRTIQVKSRYHNNNGWYRKRDSRITIILLDRGCQKTGSQCTDECGCGRGETCQINQLQTKRVGERTDQ